MENPTANNSTNPPNKPNIILITVDQMRFPMNLPPVDPKNPAVKLTPNDFLVKYMPNLHRHLWSEGVKFSNYYTAASDCTAARATIHTGLYAYQTYSMLTLITYPPSEPQQPVLKPEFPTIGRLLRDEANYETPYFGKWHLSYDVANLKDYGYTSHTPNQDYPGYAGEGHGTDGGVAWEAADWITKHVAKPGYKPFFLTVNFVNPHDKQFFWGGMQANNFYEVYRNIPLMPADYVPPGPYIQIPAEATPPQVYPTDIGVAITNFEDQTRLDRKPATQTLVKEVFQYQMGGIYEVDEYIAGKIQKATAPKDFFYGIAPAHEPDYKAIAPETYWAMALDSYVQLLGMVDKAIGQFMDSIPDSVKQNAVFIFTSDHGEYGSSHGLQGKGGTVYEEGIRVPLIVRDSSNTFVQNITTTRNQLCSSVDLLPMIVTMGYGGPGWLQLNGYGQLYGPDHRLDLLKILRSNSENGRTYALHTTDEFVPETYNFNDSHLHVIGQITCDPNGSNKKKLGIYTLWEPDSPQNATVLRPTPANVEFYNFNVANQATEMESQAYEAPETQAALSFLFGTPQQPGVLYTQLQAPLPNEVLQDAQTEAYHKLREYEALLDEMTKPSDQSQTAEEVEQRLALVWAL